MKLLTGVVTSPVGASKGFDTDTCVRPEIAAAFFNDGYAFCVRYLSRGAESPSDLTHDEACGILRAGLALMPVQHVSAPGWAPTAALGNQYGRAAADDAQRVGFPSGINVWCDLEGAAACDGADNVIAYCKAWDAAVSEAGYVAGLYVGASCLLSTTQLYDLPFKHYWQSESQVPPVTQRGYQMVQSAVSQKVNGMSIDQDMTQADQLGGQVLWLAPNS